MARVNALLAGLSLPGVRTGHVVMNFTMEARQEGMDVPLRRGLKTNVRLRAVCCSACASAAPCLRGAVRAHCHDASMPRGCVQVAAVSHQMVDRALLEKLHRADRSLYSWTADTPEVMQRLLDEGVDAIVTGRPKLYAAPPVKRSCLTNPATPTRPTFARTTRQCPARNQRLVSLPVRPPQVEARHRPSSSALRP